jgi:DNA-binding LytR/AlgR family response regulator
MLKCIIVDDESLGRKIIMEYAQQAPFLKVVGVAKDAFEAMELLEKEEVDLMFLDIQMPDMLGTDFLKTLKKRPMVIFVTAYSSFALEGYELEVVDYILKPFSIERFIKAAYRANEIFQQKDTRDAIFVNVDYALVKIKLAEINYVEGLKDYIKIYIEDQSKAVLTKSTMKAFEERLPKKTFMRVHRSFIVNLDKIQKIKGLKVYIKNTEIPISEQNLESLLQVLNP